MTESSTSRRGRSVGVVLATVGALAVLVGFAIGRSAPGAVRSGSAPTSTLARTNLIEPIPTVDPPPGAVSTTAAVAATDTTTTTTASPQTVPVRGPFAGSAVGVAVPLAGQPIEIVAIGNGRRLLRIDLATGQYRDQPAPVQPFGRPQVIAVGADLLFPSSDPSLPTALLLADGTTRDVGPGEAGTVLIGSAMGLWRVTLGVAGRSTFADPISALGDAVGPRIDLSIAPTGLDPAGGFVVEAVGGAYAVDEFGAERITDGDLVALGATSAIAAECDDTLNCAVVRIERSTGERAVVSGDPPSVDLLSGATISADGGAAIVEVLDPSDRSSSQPTLGVFDLTTGDVAELGPAQNIHEAVWTPDGQFVLFNQGGRVVAHDRTSGEVVVVADELIAIDTFIVRPSTHG